MTEISWRSNTQYDNIESLPEFPFWCPMEFGIQSEKKSACLNLKPASLLCKFLSCLPKQSHETIPWNTHLSVCLSFLLNLFLWRTVANTHSLFSHWESVRCRKIFSYFKFGLARLVAFKFLFKVLSWRQYISDTLCFNFPCQNLISFV